MRTRRESKTSVCSAPPTETFLIDCSRVPVRPPPHSVQHKSKHAGCCSKRRHCVEPWPTRLEPKFHSFKNIFETGGVEFSLSLSLSPARSPLILHWVGFSTLAAVCVRVCVCVGSWPVVLPAALGTTDGAAARRSSYRHMVPLGL